MSTDGAESVLPLGILMEVRVLEHGQGDVSVCVCVCGVCVFVCLLHVCVCVCVLCACTYVNACVYVCVSLCVVCICVCVCIACVRVYCVLARRLYITGTARQRVGGRRQSEQNRT